MRCYSRMRAVEIEEASELRVQITGTCSREPRSNYQFGNYFG